MTHLTTELKGVYPILATPFTEDGHVDEKSLKELVRFLLTSKVNGIALFGNASEMYTLTDEERQTITNIVTSEVNGKVPLVFGTGHTGINGAVQLSKQAEVSGASALMVLPPYYMKPDTKGLYEYFAEIAKAVSIPIMIQDAPLASGVQMPVDLLVRLNEDFPNICYVKVEAPPTVPKIKEVVNKSKGKLKVFGGMNGMYYFEELQQGAIGTMPACEFPDICLEIFNNHQRGKVKEAKELFYKTLPFIRIGTLPKYAMSVHKEILKKGGVIDSSYVRNPNLKITDEIKEEVYNTISHLDMLALKWKDKRVHT